MKSQSNKAAVACDVKIYSDKGSLALRFPVRHSALWEALDGKSLKGKPKCLGIGKYGFSADDTDDWRRAAQIALAMEGDLDHPEWDKLFDPTLAKYGLGGGKYAKLATVTQLPGTVQSLPEITVGEMWETYLEWKKTVVEETTFKVRFGTLSNVIKAKVWCKLDRIYVVGNAPLYNITLDKKGNIVKAVELITVSQKANLMYCLSEAYDLSKAKGLLVNLTTENPFTLDKYSVPSVTTQQKYASKTVNGEEREWHELTDEKELENDRRSFTKGERDIIIKAFYESSRTAIKSLAPLIEFYFLTGCRTSEALPLTWKDIDFERGVIRFSKSMGLSTNKIKETKTGEVRIFYFGENSRLRELLLKIKSESSSDLVFVSQKKRYISFFGVSNAWKGRSHKKTLADGTEKEYHYPGIVTQLVEQGAIGGYLSLYHTRHTYITLTAHANRANNNALLHIASACGNSVDVILRHYLGVAESVELVEV